jgi:NAD(P) transhydrogenase
MALFAAGRQSNTDLLALDKAGLDTDERGRLVVDEHFRTRVPHIYAAGDVIGFPALASTSMEQGRQAGAHAFDHPVRQNANAVFPFGIYAVPEMSVVGRTEEELRAAGVPYETGTARFRETSRGQILGLREGLLKILVHLEDHTLLGVHIVGEGATELIHIGQAVLAHHGKLDFFVDAVFNYPTLAETYKIAALDCWNKLRA